MRKFIDKNIYEYLSFIHAAGLIKRFKLLQITAKFIATEFVELLHSILLRSREILNLSGIVSRLLNLSGIVTRVSQWLYDVH